MVVETVVPLSRQFLVGRVEKKLGKAGNVPDTILADYDAFDDYLEMVIQFGVSPNQPLKHYLLLMLSLSSVYYTICIGFPPRSSRDVPLPLCGGAL